MRKVNWRWFRVFRKEQPDLSPEHHRAEEALDSGDIDISLPPESIFLKALHAEDGVALKIMIAFLIATLILFVIIFYQQGVIYKQQKELTKVPKLNKTLNLKDDAIAVKNKTIVSQAAELAMYKSLWELQKFYKEEAKAARQELKEAQKQ